MWSKGTLMPDGGIVIPASSVKLKARSAKNGSVLQIMLQDLSLPDCEFPPGSACFLEATVTDEGLHERVLLGEAKGSLRISPEWRDFRGMPVRELERIRFTLLVVGPFPDCRILAFAENVRIRDDDRDKIKLLAPKVKPASEMEGAYISLVDGWDGTFPVTVWVSSAVHKAEKRILDSDPELMGIILSAALPQILARLYVEFIAEERHEGVGQFSGFLLASEVPPETVSALRDPNTPADVRCRDAMALSRHLTALFADTIKQQEEEDVPCDD